MTCPVSDYRYTRHVAPDGSVGVRWDYLNHDGQEQPDLFFVLKRTGEKAIYLNPQYGKKAGQDAPKYSLRWDKKRPLIKNGKTIWTNKASGFFEPDPERPGCGYGDINNNRDAVLIRKTDTEMIILVFPGRGNEAAALFTQWGTGGVSESIPNNNVPFPTKTVQTIPE